MNDQFKRLLSPGNIGSLELKNRVVTAPMWNGYGGVDGSVTHQARATGTHESQ
jgi:2,4-dienoyl-CoA reductase-like NADH-dependent reductase (Old Yellow Enzyme family)